MEELRHTDLGGIATGDETRASNVPPGSHVTGSDETSVGPRATGDADSALTRDGRELLVNDAPAARIPGYEMVREIHRGGQGVVYLAIQLSTRQKVAVKVLLEGRFAGSSDLARFDREVHVLAQLRHPNIVSIIDSGVAEGHPYFVMDYISGQPLDEYVKAHPLTLAETLRLFATICEAVNAAHVRGVIHRDLKPSNIRVDPDGQPHVLDFGLAKTTEMEAGMTLTGQFMGSLPWASPEQAEAVPSKVDIRSDVYSLGVILYQLLTGRFPYDVAGSMRDVLDRIIKTEPLRPSRAGSIVAGRAPKGTQTNWTRRLKRAAIDNEVETIVLKCLQKERERRYQSAGELARDVRRYLAGEAIDAKRDSAGYLLTKLLRRHRGPALTGAGLIILLAVFAVAMSIAYSQVAQARQRSETVAEFLESMLVMVDPEMAQDAIDTPLHVALRETVAHAEADADKLAGEPEVQARVRVVLGRSYINLGLYDRAAQNLELAVASRRAHFGEHSAPTGEALYYLAWARKEQGQFEEAEKLYDEALAIAQQTRGAADPAVTDVINGLGQLAFEQKHYDEAEPLLRDALARRQREDNARNLATALANLGSLMRDTGRLAAAEPLLRQALELRQRNLGEQHFHTLVSLNKLGLLQRDRGELDEARELFSQALQARRAQLGNGHPHVAVSLNNLALTEYDAGKFAEAAELFEQAVEIWRQQLGAEHPRVARGLVNRAAAEIELGDLAAAEATLNEATGILPADSAERGALQALRGRLYLRRGDPGAAEEALREAVERLRVVAGDGRPTAIATSELGEALARLGRMQEARPLLAESHARLRALRGDGDRETQRAAERLEQFPGV